MSNVIRARGLTKTYGSTRALDEVSFDVGEGRIVGLIGPNGAGKTTALKAILGLTSFHGDLNVLGGPPLTRTRYDTAGSRLNPSRSPSRENCTVTTR